MSKKIRNVCSLDDNSASALNAGRLFAVLLFLAAMWMSAVPRTIHAEISDERKPLVADLPEGIPTLPDTGEKDNALLISRGNVNQFSGVLIAPLSAWIKDGRFIARAMRQLNFAWELGAGWEEGSRANVGRYDLDSAFNLIQVSPHVSPNGFPFGLAVNIDAEKDAVRKAYMILWNSAYAQSAAKDVLYGIDLEWIGAQSLLRRGSGTLYRRFYSGVHQQPAPATEHDGAVPSEAGAAAAAPLLLRQEYLRMFSPPVASGYAQLAWRYRGPREDDVWIYSPVLNRARKLFQANRSDPLLGGTMTFDDIFVWADKIQSADAKVVADKVLLVPFPALNYYRLKPEPLLPAAAPDASNPPRPDAQGQDVLTVRGFYQRPDGTNATLLWNHETKLFPQGAAWVPTTVGFVPRSVWVLEIGPRNPFYSEGRQILVIDKETVLPVYRMVYDRYGSYLRTVIGGWLLADGGKGQPNLPFAGFVLTVDQGMRRVMSVTTKFSRTFFGNDSTPAVEIRKLLDITSYGQQKPAQPPPPEDKKSLEGQDVDGESPDQPAEKPTAPAKSAPRPKAGGQVEGTED